MAQPRAQEAAQRHLVHHFLPLYPPAYAGAMIAPGSYVRHPDRPDWGLGQVQSMIGHRITVNFQNAGKLLIDARQIELVEVKTDDD